jgi:hypothetical protein
MAFCPFAVQQIIPESHTQGRITPTTLIYHEAVSSADSLQGYWNSPGVELESHFYIGETGTIFQFVDTEVRADANVDANGFAISVESWDDSNRDPLLAWNPAMLAAAKRLAAWCVDVHDIPARAPAAWNSGGIGGHNWFAVRWAGGARQCPGVNRSAQIRNDIIPYVAAGGGWGNTTEDDMANFTDEQRDVVVAAARKILAEYSPTADDRPLPIGTADDITGHVLSIRGLQEKMRNAEAIDRVSIAAIETVVNRIDQRGASGGMSAADRQALAADIAAKLPENVDTQAVINALLSVQGTVTYRTRPTGG